MKHQVITIVALLTLAAASLRGAGVRTHPAVPAADNSRQNRHLTSTAQSQPNNRADRLMAAHVRRVIVADDTLSIYAKNIKIIVVGGKVTLEGPVHSHEESLEIAFDASTVVDGRCIVDKLTVA